MQIDLSLQYEPEQIISIVSPSRSGSTIIKHALSLHPELTSLDGEEEPYYKLAQNGYPWHPNDEFKTVNNPQLVRALIANEVHGHNRQSNRRWLQENHVEEPPFVDVDTLQNVKPTKILLLKTPQNCYRRGVLEQLYPKAYIRYMIVTRELPAIVNGLMDGWEKPGVFEARWVNEFGAWWKFDMPKGWSFGMTVEERSIFQAKAALAAIDRDYADVVHIMRYEAFCAGWRAEVAAMWGLLGLKDIGWPKEEQLPVLMATDEPNPTRWVNKRPWLEKLK